MIKLFYILVICFTVTSGCHKTHPGSRSDTQSGKDSLPSQTDEILKVKRGWTIDTLGKGLVHYEFKNYYQPQSANQFVNVLDLNLNSPKYKLIFVAGMDDTLSAVAQAYGAIAGVNGTYEADASFIKENGHVYSPVTIQPGNSRWWKHKGAVFYNGGTDMKISYGTKKDYMQSSYMDIFSSAPVLIDDYKPFGDFFKQQHPTLHHMNIRNPRTVIALTPNKHVLLITVDGRFPQYSAGMTMKELTQFVAKYFKPQYALNMDGGGSTTMYIKGNTPNGVVNYPTDNKIHNHYGQRKRISFFLIKKVIKSKALFNGGDGTESHPYLIADAAQLQNLHKLDWSSSLTNPPYFKLVNDVDMSGEKWIPLDKSPYNRRLHFDGGGHVIKNVDIIDGGSYSSMFGVLLGSVRNLGLVNVDIEASSGHGIGAIAGYVGVKQPQSSAKTGLIENCFSTGTISGTDAVGGIAGNIGEPFGSTQSAVINCFSTAKVTATETDGNSRAGGIAGIVFKGGIVKNCFAGGNVISHSSSGNGAGGIVGWTDSDIMDVVALNTSVSTGDNGSVGRIAAVMGYNGTQAQGENCWAFNQMTVRKGSTVETESNYNTGTIVKKNDHYDGESKTKAYLGVMDNYQSVLGWKIGPGSVWASVTNKGLPVLEWLYERGDYTDFY